MRITSIYKHRKERIVLINPKYPNDKNSLTETNRQLEQLNILLKTKKENKFFFFVFWVCVVGILLYEFTCIRNDFIQEYQSVKQELQETKTELQNLSRKFSQTEGDVLAIDKKDGKYVIEILGDKDEQK